jgi:hypothetical protein
MNQASISVNFVHLDSISTLINWNVCPIPRVFQDALITMISTNAFNVSQAISSNQMSVFRLILLKLCPSVKDTWTRIPV